MICNLDQNCKKKNANDKTMFAYLLSPAPSRVPGVCRHSTEVFKHDELGFWVNILKHSLLLFSMFFISDKMDYKVGKHTIEAWNFFQNILLPFSTCPRSWEVGQNR